MVPIAPSGVGIQAALRARIVGVCTRDLSKTFVAWLLRESSGHEFASIAAVAAKREGAGQDFQTVAILGFAADAGLLGESELMGLKKGLGRLAGRAPVIEGVQLGFPSDPVGILGIALGTCVMADAEIGRRVADWAARFLKSAYMRERADDWERCLFAAADRKLRCPVGLPMPASTATADVRMALLAVDLVDYLTVEPRQDAALTLTLADQAIPEDFSCERAALRLKALEWAPKVLQSTPSTEVLSFSESSETQDLKNGPDVHVFWGPYWTGGILSLRNEGTESAKNVRLRCSTAGGWRPILRPEVVASISAGTTARVVDETAQTPGHGQSIADFVHSLPSNEHTMTVTFEDRLGERRERDFRVIAAEKRTITDSLAVTFYAGALRRVATPRIQIPRASSRQEGEQPDKSRSGKHPTRRNPRYKQIDAALKEISESRPRTQEEVFQLLDGRHVPLPPAEPFLSARGWNAGFSRNRAAARAWLSKRWAELNLLPLPRGPKSRRK